MAMITKRNEIVKVIAKYKRFTLMNMVMSDFCKVSTVRICAVEKTDRVHHFYDRCQ